MKLLLAAAVLMFMYSYVLTQESEELTDYQESAENTGPVPRYIFKPTTAVNLSQWTPTVVTLGELLFGRTPYIIG